MPLFNKDSVSPDQEISPRASDQTASDVGGVSVIGPGIVIEGTIEGSQDLVIRGRVRGEVRLEAKLRIEKGGTVDAQVHAREVEVAGTAEGSIVATVRVELEATARVTARVSAPLLVVHEGAQLAGSVSMSGKKEKKESQESN